MNAPPVWNTPPKCLRCQIPMERGFSIDSTYGAAPQTTWIEGEPQTAKFLGMRVDGVVRGEKDAARYPITLFRCPQCGCLEAYALPAQPSSK